jgi:hypothetical protein
MMMLFCHPEPGPEFISGSAISGSGLFSEMLDQICPEEILNQVQNDTFRVQL